MRRLSHAKDCDSRCPGRLRNFAYVQVCDTRHDGQIQNSQRLHELPQGQVDRLGDKRACNVEERVTVAHFITVSLYRRNRPCLRCPFRRFLHVLLPIGPVGLTAFALLYPTMLPDLVRDHTCAGAGRATDQSAFAAAG